MCFYRVIETRVKVWENEKCCRRVFPQLWKNTLEEQLWKNSCGRTAVEEHFGRTAVEEHGEHVFYFYFF